MMQVRLARHAVWLAAFGLFLLLPCAASAITQSSGDLTFTVGGSERARITSSGNIAIGTTSPGYTLDVRAAAGSAAITSTTSTNPVSLTMGNSGNMAIGREGSAGGSIATGSAAYSGVINVGNSYPLHFATNGAVRATIDTSGNVGIGTTDMSASGANAKFAVAGGTINLDDDNAILWGGTTGRPQIKGSKAGNYIIFGNTSGETMRLAGGNLGIGTTNPSLAPLQTVGMVGNTAATFASNTTGISIVAAYPSIAFNSYFNSAWLALQTGYGGMIQLEQGSGAMIFDTAASVTGQGTAQSMTERMRITNSDNVGIGTTSPGAQLDLSGGYLRMQGFPSTANPPASGKGLELTYDQTNDIGYMGAYNRSTSAYKQVRIDGSSVLFQLGSGGNVGIGTTNAGNRLTVVDNRAGAWAASIGETNSTSNGLVVTPGCDGSCYVLVLTNAAGSSWTHIFYGNGNATMAGTLTQNSDARLKTNIKPLGGDAGLAAVSRLNPVTFNWKDASKPGTQIGFIAQEVQKIFPLLIATSKNKSTNLPGEC